jgi:hypothetical protein
MAEDKILALQKKKEQIEAQITSEKARRAKDKRKLETKLRILVGAFTLKQHRDNDTIANLCNDLDSYLTKPADRKALTLLRSEIAYTGNKDLELSNEEGTDKQPTTE